MESMQRKSQAYCHIYANTHAGLKKEKGKKTLKC